jgi:D-arabinose 1-dehydrogenase-like Zn-dependent alcohol dehydrogenase
MKSKKIPVIMIMVVSLSVLASLAIAAQDRFTLKAANGAAGTPADSEDTLHFAELSGVRPTIETYPLEKAAEAYARMMSGKAQFRVVLRCEVGP